MSTSRRITHVVRSDAFAGVERYICDTVTELAARGWDVSVVGGDPSAMRGALPAQIRVEPADTTARVSRALRSLGHVDLVHAHMTAAELGVAPLKGRAFDALVSTRHFTGSRGTSLGGRATAGYISRRLDRQIAISQYVADHIETPSTVLHHGVPRSVRTPTERSRTVVLLQRLQPEKDTATAVRAWAHSELASEGWQMRVYGTGAEQSQLRALASDLGVAESVTFHGFTSDPRGVLASAGLLLATAPAEPFGLSVVEAMAERTPVIAADGGAHRETLGPDAVYFTPGNAAEAGSLLRAWAKSPNRLPYGQLLQERHGELFTIQAHVDRLENLYREVLR